jgi:hypothetical protein
MPTKILEEGITGRRLDYIAVDEVEQGRETSEMEAAKEETLEVLAVAKRILKAKKDGEIHPDRIVRVLSKEIDLLAGVKVRLLMTPVVGPWEQEPLESTGGLKVYRRKDVTGVSAAEVRERDVTERDVDGNLIKTRRWRWGISFPAVRGNVLNYDGHDGPSEGLEFLDDAMRAADEMLVTKCPTLLFLDPEDGIGIRMAR